ncbi:hypothetical protein EKH84_05920 [Cellulosilyticum sp. WCF-2]|nr:hypothetical protein EKH84_05920 [Cellulosilyticum sp. WCF-2]
MDLHLLIDLSLSVLSNSSHYLLILSFHFPFIFSLINIAFSKFEHKKSTQTHCALLISFIRKSVSLFDIKNY